VPKNQSHTARKRPTRQQGPQRRDGSRGGRHRGTAHAVRQPTTRARRPSRAVLLGGAVAIAALVVGMLVLATQMSGKSSSPSGASITGAHANAELFAGIPQHGNVLGSPQAPVTLVEYADLQCPYCATFAVDTLPYLVDDYVRTGKVKVEFRGMHFVGPDSEKALRAVVAAGQQNRLWTFMHLLYANQGMENSGWLSDELLRDAASAVPGLDAGLLDRANDADVTARIARFDRQATADAIRSTPSFLVGRSGRQLESLVVKSLGTETFTNRFDELLAR
jgi:protein-disulfide isomerase